MGNLNFPYVEGYTHGGIFHADDVFSAAFLNIINGYHFKITRGFNPPTNDNKILPDVLVFDIGGGKFDHHGIKETRSNGIPYAAFGKLWREYAKEAFGEYVANKVDSGLVQEIDAYDNGVEGSASNISRFIHNLNPLWNEKTLSSDDAFVSAVIIAEQILGREIEVAQSVEGARDYVNIMLDKRANTEILVLYEFAPWIGEAFKHPELLFCVFPSSRGDGAWNLQVIPKGPNTREARLDVPTYWKGFNIKNGKEAPVEGMTFCHPSGFLSAFETEDQAISAAKKAIEFSKLEMPKPDVQALPNS